MIFQMRDVGRSISDLEIQALENKIGVAFPASYKIFLKNNNGGRPMPKFFPIQGFENNPIGQVLDFYAIDDPIDSCRLDWVYEVMFGRIPKGFLPIACDDGGNLICLSYLGDKSGSVYFWDHNFESIPPTYDNIYKIADTFDEFLGSFSDHYG